MKLDFRVVYVVTLKDKSKRFITPAQFKEKIGNPQANFRLRLVQLQTLFPTAVDWSLDDITETEYREICKQ